MDEKNAASRTIACSEASRRGGLVTLVAYCLRREGIEVTPERVALTLAQIDAARRPAAASRPLLASGGLPRSPRKPLNRNERPGVPASGPRRR